MSAATLPCGPQPRREHGIVPETHPPNTLWACLYVSSAAPGLSLAEIDALLIEARRRNEQDGITGVLLFGGGNFMQYFEGPRAAAEALLARLLRDKRHFDMHLIMNDPVEARRFSSWAMGFLTGEATRLRAGHAALANDQALRARVFETGAALENLMRQFYETMR